MQPPGGGPGAYPAGGYTTGAPAAPPAGERHVPRTGRGLLPSRSTLLMSAIASGLAATALVATTVTGGFAAEGSGPDVAPVGESIDQVHFETKVLGASWVTQKLGKRAYRNMAARLRVTNTADRPTTLADYTKAVIPLQAWGGALLSAQAKAYTGGTETDELTPGVPTDVVVKYTPNDNERHAGRLSLRFCGFEHRSDFYYSGHQIWVPECDSWGSFDPREMVSPKDITAPGHSPAEIAQKARELNKQGSAARKKKVFNPDGIVAQVNVPLRGGP